ncbi:uncharacterized protein LOC111867851 [Cryptotermes secundus]|uniref:uncharacterized protein LOC111867851 n=1 Tax=Cryptotermes secundus TaxID=105785 RepID=UPI000CD7B554|nr:uncharacterized protein LOC111867851 [Cryptotermes secundus]
MEEKQHDAGITSRPVPIETPTIAVRLPPFWAERPAVWFAQAEAQFTLAGISSEQTMFCYVISQLDKRYASEVEDIITSPTKRGPYILLRTELVRRLSPLPEQRIRQLLTVEEFGERKPSHFLSYLKSLAPEVPDNVIRSVWTSRLPRNVQSFLAGQNEINLEAADLCADRIFEVEFGQRSLALMNPRTFANFGRRSLNSRAKWLHSGPNRTASTPTSGSPTTNRETEAPVENVPAPPSFSDGPAASALGHKTVFRPAGKLTQRTSSAADVYATITGRLFIKDRVSKRQFLVDTGTDLCVYPPGSSIDSWSVTTMTCARLMALPSTHTAGCLSASTWAYAENSRGASWWPMSRILSSAWVSCHISVFCWTVGTTTI